MNKRKWTSQERDLLEHMYKAGFSATQISQKLKRSRDSVNKALSRNNVRNQVVRRHKRFLKKICLQQEQFVPFAATNVLRIQNSHGLISYQSLLRQTPKSIAALLDYLASRVQPHSRPRTLSQSLDSVPAHETKRASHPVPVQWLESLGKYDIRERRDLHPQYGRCYEVRPLCIKGTPMILSAQRLLVLANSHRTKLHLPNFTNRDMMLNE